MAASEAAEKVCMRDRLLEAAIQVFSTEGIKGATTREIVRVAGVNESTLFRYFPTKEILLEAVLQKYSAEMMAAFAEPDIWSGDLKADLLQFARIYNHSLEKNEAMVRTFIGESRRQPEKTRLVLQNGMKTLRDKLIHYLHTQQENGQIRPEINLDPVVDGFTGILLAGMLRRGFITLPYDADTYLETCVDLFIQGIAPNPILGK